MRTLVTGGAGFIGTHLVVALAKAGHEVVVVDDFSTGSLEGLARAQVLAGAPVRLFKGDVADADIMARALDGVDVVFHLAAGKQVGESMALPEKYLLNNTDDGDSLGTRFFYVPVMTEEERLKLVKDLRNETYCYHQK